MKKLKLTKKAISAIISVVVAAAVVTALLIINIFYPLKYLTAYIVSGSRSPLNNLTFHFLDVGQADCAIAELPEGRTMLIDGGDGSYTSTLKILTELNRLDIDRIDYLVCTSVNGEHCGGLGEIIKNKEVGEIFYPYSTNSRITAEFYQFTLAAEASDAQLTISRYGEGAAYGDFFFTFLAPSSDTGENSEYAAMNSDPTAENIGAASAVMWFSYGGAGVLYAGDSTSERLELIAAEYESMQSFGDPEGYFSFEGRKIDLTTCKVYKVAGHGGEGSRATRLTELLAPSISVISVGADNAEGCPSLSVMADLAAFGEDGLFITMYGGDVTVSVTEKGEATAAQGGK